MSLEPVFYVRPWNKWKVKKFLSKVQEIPNVGHSPYVAAEKIRHHIIKRIESAPKRIISLVIYFTQFITNIYIEIHNCPKI